MSKYLVKVTEVYRCDTEAEAVKLIEDAKTNSLYELVKYSNVRKCTKQKGEIVDEWSHVELTKVIDDEKEPVCMTQVEYNDGRAF